MTDQILTVHDDLMEQNGKDSLTCKFCAPIFITHIFGTFFDEMGVLLPVNKNLPKRRSGTLTFVEYKGQVYGLTCRHVVEALNSKESHFTIPQKNFQIRIISQFHPVPKDPLSNKSPDVSIAKVNPWILEKIGRYPIPLKDNPVEFQNNDARACGIATGYPEEKRRLDNSTERFNTLAIPCITVYSPFELFTNTSLNLISKLSEEPDAEKLSGMSGGPIIWSTDHSWGLAGIIKEGADLKNKSSESILPDPGIWIEGERIPHQKLVEWLTNLPEDNNDSLCPDKIK